MSKMKKWLFVSAIWMFLSGCSAEQASMDDAELHIQYTEPIAQATIIATRLEMIAEKHPLVKSASCVIIGKAAIIGLEVDSSMKQQRREQVRHQVTEEIVKDPYGTYALVTTDSKINKRLKEIAEQISKGHPVNGFAGELVEMMKQLMPHEKKPVA